MIYKAKKKRTNPQQGYAIKNFCKVMVSKVMNGPSEKNIKCVLIFKKIAVTKVISGDNSIYGMIKLKIN